MNGNASTTEHPSTEQQAQRLVGRVRDYGSCAVAFSAGVDSAVVLKAAFLALGDRAAGVIGVGAALAEGELEQARQLARQIGVRLVETPTEEIHLPAYQANQPDRCFHCKTELYDHVRRAADGLGIEHIANGANADDRGDHRPGMTAANQHGVRSPLIDCGYDKQTVRRIAQHWGLPVWDKPASPCLASRLAYGLEVTPERLEMVDSAEQALRSFGLREVRVRMHEGPIARIEAPVEALAALAADPQRSELVERLERLGFKRVTLDLRGFESGSLNSLLPSEELGRWRRDEQA